MIADEAMAPAGMRALAVAAAALLGASWWLVEPSTTLRMGLLDVVLFIAAAAVMELLPIRLPDQRAVPTSLAVVGAAAIVGAAPPVLALIAAAGWGSARLLDRGAAPTAVVLQRAAGGWTLAGVAALGSALGPDPWRGVTEHEIAASVDAGAAAAVGVAILVGVPVLGAFARRSAARFLVRRSWEAVHANLLVGTAVSATAALGALVHPVLQHWTLPTMLIPLFAARIGLDRLAMSSRAYDQTLRAMSRLPEQLDTVSEGHGVRVAVLAREVALELGLDARLVADVVRAAHLHELGRIQLEHDGPVTQRELAVLGAGVIGESPRLARAARIVEAHGRLHDMGEVDPGCDVGARIVAACCDIDRYAPDPWSSAQRQEVVVRLVRDVGDLDVVAALTRVLDRGTAAV